VRRMLRTRAVGVAIVVAAVGVGMAANLAAASGGRAVLGLRHTHLGALLVNSRGFTLYAFTRDARNQDACARISQCLTAWPPVTTSGSPIAGQGVRAGLIGTITLRGGIRQVTYAGHALYTYIGDTGPGQTFYVNFLQFGGRWPALSASGSEVK